MNKNLDCTTSASKSFGSLLSTTISSDCVKNNTEKEILPYFDLLPTGQYISKILSVSEGVYGNKPYIDCVHELADGGGKVYRVKFRYFAPAETNALLDKLAEYKLVGSMAEALDALEENVTISPRPGSAKYVFISQRALATPTASPPAKKTSSLGKLSKKAKSSLGSQSRQSLLDDDDPEFDDFLEDDDE